MTVSLRDYFAIQILTVLMQRYEEEGYDDSYAMDEAYRLAEGMLDRSLGTPKSGVCHWKEVEDGAYWETGCGGAFELTSGTPKNNKMAFCPYCGKKIVEVKK